MIETISMSAIISISALITAVGGAWLTLRKISKDTERQKKVQSAAILQSAKEADAANYVKLDNKIHDLSAELKVFKENSRKDLEHLKETHSGEIKFLGQKIEELRSEVRYQHGQLVSLLTKMID